MRRLLVGTLCFCFLQIHSILGCDCGPQPVAVYADSAAVIFVGRVIFTDEDGAGAAQQRTMVHFQIEQSFKGLTPDVHDVWIGPGRFCDLQFTLGSRYLVFANLGGSLSFKNSQAEQGKSLSDGIDRNNPPPIYRASECSGTLPINSKYRHSVSRDIEFLRKHNSDLQGNPSRVTP
jgi:hypothetical protein